MAKKAKKPTPPLCAHCDQPAHLVSGREVYPHRPDLYDKTLWKCTPCNAHVGCHKGGGGTRSLGRPADYELRNARIKLHGRMVDPLWETAVESGCYAPEDRRAAIVIRNAARTRVYVYLAAKMSIDVKACHVGMFTLEQCRAAWVALRGVTYPEIREWCRLDRIAKALATFSPIADVAALKHTALQECDGCRTNWKLDGDRHPAPADMTCQALSIREAMRWIEDHPQEAAARRAAATAEHNTQVIAGLTPAQPGERAHGDNDRTADQDHGGEPADAP